MKQVYLICTLLLMSLTTFARDITVHVTDQRGAAVSGLPVTFDNEYFYTDSNGDFEIRGLGSSGVYSFSYNTGYGYEQIRFSWDGTSSVVNVSLEGYFVVFRLVGLTEEDLAQVWDNYFYISTTDGSHGQTMHMDDGGVLAFWWDEPTISWRFNTDLFGDCSGTVDLEEEKGVVSIAPKNGKYKVSLGSINGHGGVAMEGVTVEGMPAESFSAVYRSPGTYSLNVSAPGYFPYACSYQVVDKDVAVDVDMSQSHVVKFKFTDRDGTAMENVSVQLGLGYDSPVIVTNASGECEAYAMPGGYNYLTSYENPLYPSNYMENITVSSQDVTEDVDWTGATLLEVRLKNAAQFKDYAYGDILSYNSVCELGNDEYMSYGASFNEVEDGEDIIVGVLAGKEYTQANLQLSFENVVKNILGIREQGIALNGGDVKLEYDFGTYLTAHLAAPEGFSLGHYMIDGIDVNAWSEEILMPAGEHRWQAELELADGQQSYPFGKEQTFTLSEDGERIVYAFNEEDYGGIRFFVEDENGNPGEGFCVVVRRNSSIVSSANTDEDGLCTVFLSEPGDYTYEVAYGQEVIYGEYGGYLPLRGSVTVGTEMAEETVSFEDYRKFSLRVTGIEMPYTEWSTALPTVEIDGLYGYFHMTANKEVTPIEYEGSMWMPQDTYSGTVQVHDGSNHSGRATFTVELAGSDVVETVDFSHYRTVDFTVNGENIIEGDVRLFREGQDFDGNYENDRLLPPGKYAALYDNYSYNFTDTVYFEITDENMVVDFQFNPEDYHAVTFVVKNQPEGTDGVYFVIDGNGWADSKDQQGTMVREGKHSFVLSYMDVQGGYYFVNTWPLEGSFEVGEEDKEVEVDLASYRMFRMRFILPDGSEWTDSESWGYDLLLSKDGVSYPSHTMELNYHALPVGNYGLTLDLRKRYYGAFTVGAECPDEIMVRLSETPVSVADTRSEEVALSAAMNNGRVSIMSTHNEDIAVCIYNLDGRVLWQGLVTPGCAADTGLQDGGIYLIRMEQKGFVKTQKLIVR